MPWLIGGDFNEIIDSKENLEDFLLIINGLISF